MTSSRQQTAPRLRVFCSYAHEDLPYLQRLRKHLSGLERSKVIEAWDDRVIRPGDSWEYEIHEGLGNADIVIILVSEDFMVSEYCWNVELETALARRHEGVQLIPLLLDSYDLEATPFEGIQMMPVKNGELVPISKWRPQSDAFTLVSKAIRRYAKDYQSAKLWNVKDLEQSVMLDEAFLDTVRAHHLAYSGVPIVITGQAGVGKSTTANAYARRFSRAYEKIFWITADNDARFSQDCAQLAQAIGVPATDQEAARSAVKRWLETNDRWLIILDNVEDAHLADRIVPRNGRGDVIMTSRKTGEWRGVATELELPPMSLDDCVEFLLKLSGSRDDSAAARLCTLMERHPLAIRKAANAIASRHISIDDYIADYLARTNSRQVS